MVNSSDIESWRDLNASTERFVRIARLRVSASLRFPMSHFSDRARRATRSDLFRSFIILEGSLFHMIELIRANRSDNLSVLS